MKNLRYTAGMRTVPYSTIVVIASLAFACAPATRQAASTTPPEVATRTLPESIRWVRASAEHRALFLQVYASAADRVREVAPTRARGSWAVILDADETILDNSEYQRRRAAQGLGFTQDTWDAWVQEAKATPLPGAAEFLSLVHELGGRSIVVTNRDDYVCPATVRNMKAHALANDAVLCREKRVSDKNPRFEAVRRGNAVPGAGPLDVVMWIGDNIQDFPGMSQEARTQSRDAFANFGTTYFLLPNPMYGSWERLPVP